MWTRVLRFNSPKELIAQIGWLKVSGFELWFEDIED